MGIWSGIKHALNSTLGTDKFKPLNEIIDEQRDLVASDSLFRYIFTGSNTYKPDNESIDIVQFKSNRNGSIRIRFSGMNTTAPTLTIRIINADNSSVVAGVSLNDRMSEYEDFYVDAIIQKGKNYKIQAYASNRPNATIKNLRICANELDISGIELIN